MKTEQGAGGSMDEARTCRENDAEMTQEDRPGSLDVLVDARPRARHAPDGSTYFVRAGDTIKIGFAENFKRRLVGLQTGHAETLEVLAVVPAALIDEYQTHQLFSHLRISGEWFRAEPDLLSFIEQAKADAEAMPRKQEIPVAYCPKPAPVVSEIETFRRKLIAMRVKFGAETAKGYACSNLVALLAHLKDYVRPDWATHEFQTLPGLMKRQMDRLSN